MSTREGAMKLWNKSWIVGSLGLAAAVTSCNALWSHDVDNCEMTLLCERHDWAKYDGGTPASCVPSENADAVGDSCGVFVATSGNDGNAGTKAEPVKTLEEAISRAAEKNTAVYVCAEEFAEAVEVPAGMTMFGGLDCASGWKWSGETKKTTVAPGAEAIPLKLASGEGTTRIEDVAAHAADAQAPGGSSIAVLVDGAKAELTRCELVAGNGADGAKGEDAPSDAPMQAPSGNKGKDACSDLDISGTPDATLPGGAQVVNECGGNNLSIGGKGGDGNKDNGGDGASSQGNTETSRGGVGEPPSDPWECGGTEPNGRGDDGTNGAPGEPGLAASGLGALSSSGYAGVNGGAGTSGKPGQGGGGGGGTKAGSALCSGGLPGAGASGGSGGAGGCGGLPGKGGGAGGASLALASLQATVTLTDCTLTAGSGGKGGAGGNAQPGGQGGIGGAGGQTGGIVGLKTGCSGGQGGQGADGGPGGGGLGGLSIGIAFRGTQVAQQGKTVATPGTAGAGGPGGSNNVAMNTGATGIAAASQELP